MMTVPINRMITIRSFILQFICLIFDESEYGAFALVSLLHLHIVASGCVGLLLGWLLVLIVLAVGGDNKGRDCVLFA